MLRVLREWVLALPQGCSRVPVRCICCAEMPGGLHDARRMVPGVRLVMLLEAMCICSASVF